MQRSAKLAVLVIFIAQTLSSQAFACAEGRNNPFAGQQEREALRMPPSMMTDKIRGRRVFFDLELDSFFNALFRKIDLQITRLVQAEGKVIRYNVYDENSQQTIILAYEDPEDRKMYTFLIEPVDGDASHMIVRSYADYRHTGNIPVLADAVEGLLQSFMNHAAGTFGGFPRLRTGS